MILVVADTGPIHYLIQIGCVEALEGLAERIVLPATVHAELLHERAPEVVRRWAAAPPGCVEVRAAARVLPIGDLALADREALSLAVELHATVLLMDDRLGRESAAALGLKTIGTVGLLEAAAARELIALPEALEKLHRTSCFVTGEILERALQRDAERRRIADG